jgi:uncharacterized SAM-binding protein YcdF (DUF218 family)
VNLIPTRWYTVLFMPSSVSLLLMAVGLVLLWRCLRGTPSAGRGARLGLSLVTAGFTLLYLASTPLVAAWLSRSLERQTPYLDPEKAPQADAIVVLGGGQQGYVAEDGSIRLFTHHAGDRFETGLRAFELGKAPLLVLGGGSLPVPGDPLVGDLLRRMARQRGVPDDRIISCGRALYTTDEIAQLADSMRARGVKHVLLCTSASHMPRARMIMERLGFQVTPLPADFDTRGSAERFTLMMLVPRGGALAQTENGLKEWIGAFREWVAPSSTEAPPPAPR